MNRFILLLFLFVCGSDLNAQNRRNSIVGILERIEREYNHFDLDSSRIPVEGYANYKSFKNHALTHELDYKIYLELFNITGIFSSHDDFIYTRFNILNTILNSKLPASKKLFLFDRTMHEHMGFEDWLSDNPSLNKGIDRLVLDYFNEGIFERSVQIIVKSRLSIGLIENISETTELPYSYNFMIVDFLINEVDEEKTELIQRFSKNLSCQQKEYLAIGDNLDSCGVPIRYIQDSTDREMYDMHPAFFRKRCGYKLLSGNCEYALEDLQHYERIRGIRDDTYWQLKGEIAVCLEDTVAEVAAYSMGINTIKPWADSIFQAKYPKDYEKVKETGQTIFKEGKIPKTHKLDMGVNFQINTLFRGGKSQLELGPGYYISTFNVFPDFTLNSNFIYDFGEGKSGFSIVAKSNTLIELEYSSVFLYSSNFNHYHRASAGFGLGYLTFQYVHNFVKKNNALNTPKSMFGMTINLPYPAPGL